MHQVLDQIPVWNSRWFSTFNIFQWLIKTKIVWFTWHKSITIDSWTFCHKWALKIWMSDIFSVGILPCMNIPVKSSCTCLEQIKWFMNIIFPQKYNLNSQNLCKSWQVKLDFIWNYFAIFVEHSIFLDGSFCVKWMYCIENVYAKLLDLVGFLLDHVRENHKHVKQVTHC